MSRLRVALLGALMLGTPAWAQEPTASPTPAPTLAPAPSPSPSPAPSAAQTPTPSAAPETAEPNDAKALGTRADWSGPPPTGNRAAAKTLSELAAKILPNDLFFALHGYFRAPLRLSWRPLPMGGFNLRAPWLVDDEYFRSGFGYLRTQESDWSEVYLTVGNRWITGEVMLFASLFSDWARTILDRQGGIAQASVTLRWELGPAWRRVRLRAKGGSFWERLGYLRSYDTYLVGRMHQMGGQVRAELDVGPVTATLLYGIGAHLDAIDINQGLTLVNYLYGSARLWKRVELGLYFVDAMTHDKRQLKELKDADMNVLGADLKLDGHWLGRLTVLGSMINASNATYLSPAVEVMHSFGGRGLTENYFGTDRSENGTGALYNFGFEYTLGLRPILARFAPSAAATLGPRELTFTGFGLLAHTRSRQVDPDPLINRDKITSFKWGGELAWQAFSFMGVAVRYDRVIANMADEASSFRSISPRLFFTMRWLLDAQIYLQYSHYFYGGRVALRPGQVPLETQPDADVVKLQAQLVF